LVSSLRTPVARHALVLRTTGGELRQRGIFRSYPVAVESGEELQKGPYVAETFPVHVEDSYVIIET
jgi:hypothetical protein